MRFFKRPELSLAATVAGMMLHGSGVFAQAVELPPVVVQGATLDKPKLAPRPAQASPPAAPALAAAPSPSPAPASTSTGAIGADASLAADDAPENRGITADKTGTSISVVTGADLRNQQVRNAADALRSLPGVSISRSGGAAGLTQLRIRGAEANHTLVLIDGIEANSGTDGEFDFSDLSADDIERIEILRGAQSGIYGSNAIGGVVNIITKGGRGPLTVTGTVEGGSLRTRDFSARASGGNDKGYIAIGVHRRENDGFNIAPQRDPNNPGFRDNDDSSLTSFSLKAGGSITKDASIDIKNELSRMEAYPDLHAQMELERARSTEQAARLDRLLAKHGTSASLVKEAVTGTVATVAGFAHAFASDEVMKDVLAAVGYKAYEIGSYKVLITLAETVGATADIAVLEQSMKEEQEMGDWLGSHLPGFVHAYIKQQAA